jgi:hypothetical protein
MKPPIIVNDNGDLLAFDTVEKAERYLEPQDVREDNELFDGEGRVLKEVIVKHLLAKRVKLEPATEPGVGTSRLRDLLADFLSRTGTRSEKPLAEWSLEALLLEMILHHRTE